MTLVLRMMPPAIHVNIPIGQGAGVNQLSDGKLRFHAMMRNSFLIRRGREKSVSGRVASLNESAIHVALILCKSMRSPLGSGSVSGTYTTFPIEIEQPEKLGRSRSCSDKRP
jgi:hypothetical protein